MSPEDEARQDIADILAELHEQGMDMGQISCLVLDVMVDWFEGINAIRRVVNGQME